MMKNLGFDKLFRRVDYLPLEIFRYFFILTLILQFYSFYSAHYLESGIIAPAYLFTFQGFSFLSRTPEGLMKLFYALLLIAPLLMLIKKVFRVAVLVYLIAFSFFFLIEQSYYNNHFYLIILYTAFWLFYKPDKKEGKLTIPSWLLFLFQVQLFIVYFYGGLVKLNSDWLFHQEPIVTLLKLNAKNVSLGGEGNNAFVINYLTYGGLIFDLLIGFLLFNRKTRWFAICLNIVFHLMNIFMFNFGEGGDIGIFPIMMIFTNVLFIPAETLRNFIQKIGLGSPAIAPPGKVNKTTDTSTSARFAKPILIIYLALQLLIPFRYLIIAKDVDWTGQASFFAWRMKSHTKQCSIRFYYQANAVEPKKEYFMGRTINTMQINQMAQHANMIFQFVQHIKKDLKKKEGIIDPIITADVMIGFNGRKPQRFIDPNFNLSNATFSSFTRPNWVLQLH
jgi:vitamin K-dependent gamma-carboxylase